MHPTYRATNCLCRSFEEMVSKKRRNIRKRKCSLFLWQKREDYQYHHRHLQHAKSQCDSFTTTTKIYIHIAHNCICSYDKNIRRKKIPTFTIQKVQVKSEGFLPCCFNFSPFLILLKLRFLLFLANILAYSK